jgi:hypothetical protein
MQSYSIPLKLPWYVLFVLLIAGSSMNLTELTRRATFLGNYNVDALRNLALLGLASIGMLFVVLQGQGKIPNFLRIWPYLLFAAWAAFSLFWTINIEYSLRELSKLVYPILVYIIAVKVMQSGTPAYKLWALTREATTFFAIVSVWSGMVALALWLKAGVWTWGESRLLNIPMHFASIVSAALVVLELAAWKAIPGWRPRKWLMVLLFLDVVLSLTRTDIFALLVAIFVVWSIAGRRLWRLVGGCVFGLIIVTTLLVVDNPVKDRMFWRPQQVTLAWLAEMALTEPGQLFSENHIKFSGRIGFWEHVLSESRAQRPALIGSGIGSSRPLIMSYARNPSGVVHSDYVGYLAELGYVGITLFIIMWATIFVVGLRAAFKKNILPVKRAAAITLVGLTVLNCIVSIAYNPSVQILIFYSIAMVMLAILFSKQPPVRMQHVPPVQTDSIT